MRLLVLPITAFAISLCTASAIAASTDYDRVGYWNTDYGILEIRQEWYGSISAHIILDDGQTTISLDDQKRTETGGIAFLWTDMDDSWGPACDETFFITKHWGIALIEAEGEDQLRGTWADCELNPESAVRWHGVLIAGYHWMSEEGDAELMPDRPFLDLPHDDALELMADADFAGFDPATAQSFAFDMTCDGGTDQVFVWTDVDVEKGPALRIAVNHALPPINEEAPEFETALGQRGVRGTGESSVCVADGVLVPIQVSLQPMSDEERKERRLPASCLERLEIAAEGCRPLAAYWSPGFDVIIDWGD